MPTAGPSLFGNTRGQGCKPRLELFRLAALGEQRYAQPLDA